MYVPFDSPVLALLRRKWPTPGVTKDQSPEYDLPFGWESSRDSLTSRVYYFNRNTGVVQWERPGEEQPLAAWGDPPAWDEVVENEVFAKDNPKLAVPPRRVSSDPSAQQDLAGVSARDHLRARAKKLQKRHPGFQKAPGSNRSIALPTVLEDDEIRTQVAPLNASSSYSRRPDSRAPQGQLQVASVAINSGNGENGYARSEITNPHDIRGFTLAFLDLKPGGTVYETPQYQ